MTVVRGNEGNGMHAARAGILRCQQIDDSLMFSFTLLRESISHDVSFGLREVHLTTDVITNDALTILRRYYLLQIFLSSRRI